MSNNKINSYRITVLYECLSPITHMMGVSGNEALINRESVYTENGIKSVPVLSGNALRHKTIREPGAKHLVSKYELNGVMTVDQVNFMLVGGSLTESSVTDNLKTISDLKEFLPLFRLLGGSLRNQIIAGSLQNGRGILVCQENKETLKKLIPKEFEITEKRLQSFESFISNYQYTRGDIKNKKNIDWFLESSKLSEERDSTLMIYAGQTIIAGSLFYQDIVCPNVSEIEIGALLNAFQNWQNYGGIIGGKSSIGHGKLNAKLYIESDSGILDQNDFDELIEKYNEYILKVKENAIKWLFDNLGERVKEEKKEKPKKEKTKTKKTEIVETEDEEDSLL